MRRAVRVLRAGGVVAYPTEAVYGLGCEPLDGEAVEHLLALKHRVLAKGVILIAASFSQLRPFVVLPDAAIMRRLRASWPGPTTWLLPARPGLPYWLTGRYRSLGVRVTAHPQAAALCASYGGALISTSANVSGMPPARSALDVRKRLGTAVDYVLPGRVGGARRPSEIRDALTDRIIRTGGRG